MEFMGKFNAKFITLGKQSSGKETTQKLFRDALTASRASGVKPKTIGEDFMPVIYCDKNPSLSELAKFGTLSDNMAKLLSLSVNSKLNILVTGTEGSGKTTTAKAVKKIILPETKVLSVKHKYDTEDTDEVDSIDFNECTLDNIIKISPDTMYFEELRYSCDFNRAVKCGLTWHSTLSTTHGSDALFGLDRIAIGLIEENKDMSMEEAVKIVSDGIDLVVIQSTLPDGSRKVIGITEVNEAKDGKFSLNVLYTLSMTEYKHVRVGVVSDWFVRRFTLAGFKSFDYAFMTADTTNTEVETYTGKNTK